MRIFRRSKPRSARQRIEGRYSGRRDTIGGFIPLSSRKRVYVRDAFGRFAPSYGRTPKSTKVAAMGMEFGPGPDHPGGTSASWRRKGITKGDPVPVQKYSLLRGMQAPKAKRSKTRYSR